MLITVLFSVWSRACKFFLTANCYPNTSLQSCICRSYALFQLAL